MPPLTVDADHSTATQSPDSDTGRITYDGRVVITRGKAVIHGAHAVVYTRRQHLEKAVVTGSPTHFSWQPETGLPVHGNALKVTYLAGDDTIELRGEATLHRGAEVFTAPVVLYDLDTKVLTAGGGENGKDGRVHVVIPPATTANGPAARRP